MAKIIPLSLEKYIMTKGRSLPLHECYISEGWRESGIANVFVSRKQPSGNIIYAIFLVDLFCLGIKSAYCEFNILPQEFLDIIEHGNEGGDELVKCDYVLAHNIIYGAMAYADDIGFKPHKDFSFAQYLLEDDTEDIPLIDIEFGRKGKPCLIVHEGFNADHLRKRLDSTVGKGNYDFLIGLSPDNMNEEEDEIEEEYAEEDETDEDSPEEKTEKFYSLIAFLYDEEFKHEKAAKPSVADTMLIEYEITDKPLELFDLPIEKEEGERLYRMVNDTPEKAIPRLEELIMQHPGFPVFYNHLMCAYQYTGRKEQVEGLIIETYRKFPNYLFARIGYANMLINKGKISEVPQVFDNKYELSLVYPERKKFHVNEVEAFNITMVHYFTAIDKLHQANIYMKALEGMDVDVFSNPLMKIIAQKLHEKKLDKLIASGFLNKAKDRMKNFLTSTKNPEDSEQEEEGFSRNSIFKRE